MSLIKTDHVRLKDLSLAVKLTQLSEILAHYTDGYAYVQALCFWLQSTLVEQAGRQAGIACVVTPAAKFAMPNDIS
jgi:hypothetical protein